MAVTLNNKVYDWVDVQIELSGVAGLARKLTGVTAIKYSDNREMQYNFGLGSAYPVSRSFGKCTAEASMTLNQFELEALQEYSKTLTGNPTGDISLIRNFDIIIKFMDQGGNLKAHALRNCVISTNGRETTTDSLNMQHEIPLMPHYIDWGVQV